MSPLTSFIKIEFIDSIHIPLGYFNLTPVLPRTRKKIDTNSRRSQERLLQFQLNTTIAKNIWVSVTEFQQNRHNILSFGDGTFMSISLYHNKCLIPLLYYGQTQ